MTLKELRTIYEKENVPDDTDVVVLRESDQSTVQLDDIRYIENKHQLQIVIQDQDQ